MPQGIAIIAAYITAQATAVVGSSLLAAQIVYATAYVAVTVGASAALNYALSALQGGGVPTPAGQTVSSTAPVEPNRHLVGRGRTYGVTAQQGSCAANAGDDKNLAFFQIQTISSTPITEVEKVLVADIEMIPIVETMTGAALFFAADLPPYNSGQALGKSRLYYNFDIGSDPGVRDPLVGWYADQVWQPLVTSPYLDGVGMVPFYSPDARGDGLAKLSSVAYQDVNSFPAGPPRVSVVAKGIACYDPRDPDQHPLDRLTWTFTENPALIAAWYITRPFGFDSTYDEIDLDILIASANACEEMVETFESTLPEIVGPPPLEMRYRCGGEVIESENRDDVLAAICASMAGSWSQTGGRWYIFAGVYFAPTVSIDDTWIMRNVQFVAQGSRLQLYNTVQGVFMSEARRWQTAPYPQVQEPDLLAADNGQEIIETVDLAYVPSHTQAQRCMLIELRRSHKPRAFSFETPIGFAMRVVIGQAISLSQLAVGYMIDDMPARVSSWELSEQDDTGQIWVKISLDEDGPDIYASTIADLHDADGLTQSDPAPNPESGDIPETDAPTGTIEEVIA